MYLQIKPKGQDSRMLLYVVFLHSTYFISSRLNRFRAGEVTNKIQVQVQANGIFQFP